MRGCSFTAGYQGALLCCGDSSNTPEGASQEENGESIHAREGRSKGGSWEQAGLIWETARGQGDSSSVCKGGSG